MNRYDYSNNQLADDGQLTFVNPEEDEKINYPQNVLNENSDSEDSQLKYVSSKKSHKTKEITKEPRQVQYSLEQLYNRFYFDEGNIMDSDEE